MSTTFYTLAFNGVPIAEELTMGWDGWAMNEPGRQTFRENYLGAGTGLDRCPKHGAPGAAG